MIDNSNIVTVFIESAFLRGTSHNDPNYRKLLEHSKSNKVKIYISDISLNEWRTQKVEELYKTILAVKNCNDIWKTNIISESLPNPHDVYSYPTDYEIEELSERSIKEFVDVYKIERICVEDAHTKEVLNSYFKGNAPFRNKKHRSDIPDAWVYQAAVSLLDGNKLVYFLCRDDRNKEDQQLTDALKSAGLKPVKLNEILSILELPESVREVLPTVSHVLEQSLSDLAEEDKELRVKIIGYAKWFEPIPKEKLLSVLEKQGYLIEKINNIAQRLVIAGFLKDTGNYYLTAQNNITQQAADSIQDEILELINKNDA